MAIATGKPVNDAPIRQLYTGVLPLQILAINPNKKELEKIYGRELPGDDPIYFTKDQDGVSHRLRIEFIVKTLPDKCNGIDMIGRISFNLRDSIQLKADKTKFKASNKYNQVLWLTKEEYKEGKLPDNIKPHFFLLEGVRPMYVGEENLMRFIAAAVNIPNVVADFTSGELIPDKSEAECRFDSMKEMVTTGNITELKRLFPAFKAFKMGAGVRTADDNRTYQDWFIEYPMKFGTRDLKYYAANLDRVRKSGRYASTNFGEMPFTPSVYTIAPSATPTASNEIPEPKVPVSTADELDW